jgi:GGDEF domain-containing protein
VTDPAREQPSSTERLSRGARAAQSLSEALWETLHEAVAEHRTGGAAELCERLAEISLAVASLADAEHRPPPESRQAAERPREVEQVRARGPVPGSAVPKPVVPKPDVSGPVVSGPVVSGPVVSEPDVPEPVTAAVLVDELAGRDPVEARGASRSESQARPSIEIRDERMPIVDLERAPVEQEHARHGYAAPAQAERAHTQHAQAVSVRAERAEAERVQAERAQTERVQAGQAQAMQDPDPWIVSIERRLERYSQDRQAFALLLLELADAQRLRHAELPGEVARLTSLVEVGLSGQLRPADSLVRETPGRYWLLAPQTDRASAQTLARELTEAVSRAASHRGAPLRLAVGIAVCPEDALSASELLARAEVALYEAHAGGRAVMPAASASVVYEDLA